MPDHRFNPRSQNNLYLRDLLSELKVYTVADFGWNGCLSETQADAYLAKRSIHGLEIRLPTTNCVCLLVSGGNVFYHDDQLRHLGR